jgi:hypothetical protein
MWTFTRPMGRLMETLREWRSREKQMAAQQSHDETAAANHYDMWNMSLWFLPPPC